MTFCGATNRQGTPCQRPAGWGTDHVGIGKCKLHGGKTPIKTGRYSEVLSQKLRGKIDAIQDPESMDLLDELVLQRALLAEYLSRFDATNLQLFDISYAFSWLNDIGRMVERIAKMRNESALTAAEVKYLQVRAVDVAIKYFPNDRQKQEQFISDLFGVAANSGAGRPELVEGKARTR